MRNIRQNLFWAFAYNVVLIPVAAGVLYPVVGDPALADAGGGRDGVVERVRRHQRAAAAQVQGGRRNARRDGDAARGGSATMNIGEASAASGVSAKMIRYYELIGLIEAPPRTAGNYRVYGEDDVHTLRFIRRARSLGFSVEETEQLLSLWRDSARASAEVKAIALNHVADLERRIAELADMASTLKKLAKSCHGDSRPHCPILNDLAEQGDTPPVRSNGRGGVPRAGKDMRAKTA